MDSPLRSTIREGHPVASDSAAFATPGVVPTRRPDPAPPRLPSPQDPSLRLPAPEEGRPTRPSPAPPLPFLQKDSPGRSPAREEDRSTGWSAVPRVPSPREDSVVRSPAREEDRSTRPSHVPRLSSLLLQESPAWSPAHEAGRPAGPGPAPQLPPPQKESPARDGGRPGTFPPYADPIENPLSPATSIVNRAARDDPSAVTKLERGGSGGGVRDGPDAERGSRVVSGILRRRMRGEAVGRAAIGVRLSAVVLCLVSFSLMAADKTKGWAGDSFDRYREYRFCITVNILTFVYSGFQAYAQAHRVIYEKDIIRPPWRYYFDFAMDQVLAYLLISASSAAATRTDDWVSNWGNDPFTVMANWSTSVSFLAFVAVAVSALISAHSLFSGHS